MVVSHLDLPTTHEFLSFYLQVCRHEHDLGCEHSDGGLWGSLERSSIEVVTREETTEIVHDLVATLLHGPKGVHPVGIRGVDADQFLCITLPKPSHQPDQGCG